MNYKDYKGIYCHVIWGNEDPAYHYISFGEYDFDSEPECDSFGVPDDQVFYYLDKDEVLELLENIIMDIDVYPTDDGLDKDWYIDLAMGYELVPVSSPIQHQPTN